MRAAAGRGVRQEGLPAVDDRAGHVPPVFAADRDRAARDGAGRRRPGAVLAQPLPVGPRAARGTAPVSGPARRAGAATGGRARPGAPAGPVHRRAQCQRLATRLPGDPASERSEAAHAAAGRGRRTAGRAGRGQAWNDPPDRQRGGLAPVAQVLNAHITAFQRGNAQILACDYADDAVFIMPATITLEGWRSSDRALQTVRPGGVAGIPDLIA